MSKHMPARHVFNFSFRADTAHKASDKFDSMPNILIASIPVESGRYSVMWISDWTHFRKHQEVFLHMGIFKWQKG